MGNMSLAAVLVVVLIGSAGCAVGIGEGIGVLMNIGFNGIRAYAPDAPMPADARFVPPTADIPDTISAFAGGTWSGVWDRDRKWQPDRKGERRSHLLAVEEITSPEKASVIFSNGESQTRVRWRPVRNEMWLRVVAEFSDGVLVVKALSATAVYRLNADKKTLDAEMNEPGMPTLRATLYKTNLEAKKEIAKE